MGDTKRRVDVALGIIVRDGLILICRRHDHAPLGGFWEFPGGKRESGETILDCLRRELREELGIAVEPRAQLDVIEHAYPKIDVRLHPIICTLIQGEPEPLASTELKWVVPDALPGFRFPPANAALLRTVAERLACKEGPE